MGSCAAPSAKGDDKFITTDYLQQCHFARTAGFAVSLDGVGIRTTGVVRCDQPRTIDMKARGGKRLERVPETIMNEVLGRLSTILT